MYLHTQRAIPLGNEKIYISSNALPPCDNWDVQRHCNAEWEFHYIAEGSCLVDLDKAHYSLKAGQALLIQPGIYHGAKAQAGMFSRLTLCFTLSPGIIGRQLSEKARQAPVFSPGEAVHRTACRLLHELKNNGTYTDTYLAALISCLMVELMRYLQVDDQQAKKAVPDPQIRLTQLIDTYFEQHLSDNAGENELAKELHVSRRQLVRILKKYYSMTFREKLIQARMDRAAFLLRTTEQPINQIGADVGYGRESAFFKVFRRSFDCTPRQYRTQHK